MKRKVQIGAEILLGLFFVLFLVSFVLNGALQTLAYLFGAVIVLAVMALMAMLGAGIWEFIDDIWGAFH